MSRFTALTVVLVLGFAMAWAQAPASPAAAPQANAAAPAGQASISGCMTESFGIFSVADASSSKAWNVHGSGISLWNYNNHVVKVQGLEDPKAQGSILYAQTVQDTGQPCGNAQAANGTAPAAAPAASAQATAAPTTQTASAPATQPEPQQQPGGGVAQSTQPMQTNQPAAAQSAQAGTTGVTTPAPQSSENKGTPAAASPQGAIASNNGPAPAANNNSVFSGCLVGAVNDYQFKANGKTYRLQGNTSQLNSMFKHNVEITGEDFNGKAIQVNGVRDLGGSCK